MNKWKNAIKWLNKSAFDLGDVAAKIKHPTWQRYYHGSPIHFDIKQFYKGTNTDVGLHMTRNRAVANRFVNANPQGKIYKFYSPKPTMEVMDFHGNGINLFAGERNFHPLAIYDGSNDTQLLFKALRESGGDDIIEFVPRTWGPETYTPFKVKRPVTIQGDKYHWIDRSPEVNSQIQQLYNQYPKYDCYYTELTPMQQQMRTSINSQMADILAQNGHPVIKYANHNPSEGLGISYFLTDRSKMYIPQYIPVKNWQLGVGAGLGLGGFYLLNKKGQQ